MRLDLHGRRAVVTGSSQGIGLAIATGLASAGAAVVLVARDPARLAAAADHVRAAVDGADVTTVAADLAADDGTAALLAAVPDTDVLVNNLGVPGPARPGGPRRGVAPRPRHQRAHRRPAAARLPARHAGARLGPGPAGRRAVAVVVHDAVSAPAGGLARVRHSVAAPA